MKMLDTLSQRVVSLALPALALLMPLAFLPLTADFFTPHKRLVLMVIAGLALLGWVVRSVSKKTVKLALTPATMPLIIVGAIYVFSAYLQSPNTALAMTGEAGVMLALIVIFLATTSSLSKTKTADLTFKLLVGSLSAVAVVTILQFVQLGKLTGIAWLQSPLFNPAGGPLSFLSVSVPALLAVVVYVMKQRKVTLGWAAGGLLLLVASVMSGILIYTQNLTFMPWTAAWVVAMGALQNPMAALLGTGPGTYQAAYTILKPGLVNVTPAWNISFVNAANTYLHLMTTVGLVATAAYIFGMGKTVLAGLSKASNNPSLAAFSTLLAAGLVAQLLLPMSIVSMTVVFIALILVGLELRQKGSKSAAAPESPLKRIMSLNTARTDVEVENTSERYDLLFWFALALSVIFVAYSGWMVGRAYASELVFGASLRAAANNQGTETYNLQNRAIQLKPYDPQYRIAYAQTNLAIANSLAAQEDVSDDVQSDVIQLIQQAIREAKVAIQLEPANAVTWQNLAVIYQQLIGLAEGADQWTVEAYQQAMALDPTNPQLRLDLGGLFYAAENYPAAVQLFTQAVQLKPDWANAYYNLAVAYRDADQPVAALQAMRVVVELLDPASEDYQRAQDELEELKVAAQEAQEAAAAAQQQQGAGEAGTRPADGEEVPQFTPPARDEDEEQQISAPSPAPSPALDEPIELPEDAGPGAE